MGIERGWEGSKWGKTRRWVMGVFTNQTFVHTYSVVYWSWKGGTCSGIRPNFCFFHKENMEVEDHPSIYLTLIESIIHGGQVLLLVWAKHISIFILEGITCYLDFQNHFFSESSIIMIQKCNMYLWYVMHMKRWYK